jgi:hypothetical protein
MSLIIPKQPLNQNQKKKFPSNSKKLRTSKNFRSSNSKQKKAKARLRRGKENSRQYHQS